MPIYEYKCPKCGVFEAMQGIKAAALRKCPTCKSKVERQISRGSFILKGSGWYATDYAKKAVQSGSDSSEASGAPATNGGASSSDSSAKASGNSKASGDSKPGSEAKSSSESKTSPDSKGGSASKSSSDKPASAKAAD